jgi:triosephosphate isomerase
MRTPIIAANWKMNKTQKEAKVFLKELIPLISDAECEVALCVPFTDLAVVKRMVKGTKIKVGAQNVHFAEKGAYTGEISADMLKELKVDYVIIGHSERRQYFGETDESVNKKIAACLAKKLRPIVCVGETLEEREGGLTEKVLERQIREGFRGFKSKDFDKIVIAYEPVWAIGTGKNATSEDANAMIGYIRQVLRKYLPKSISEKVRIQYGGSMNSGNVKELMSMPEIDGGLIGSASLKAEEFAKIVHYGRA